VGSNPARRAIQGVQKMKTTYFENVRNREQFYCKDLKDIQMIDGVEYLRVFRMGTQRDVLVKKDTLRKVSDKK
jgi:hypothetical protein